MSSKHVGIVEVVVRNLETVILDGFQIAGLALEHVEPAAEPRPRVQRPAPRGHLGNHSRALKVVVAQRRSVEIPQQQKTQIGAVVDHRSPNARLFGRLAVVVLPVAVDTQEVATGVGAAGDVDPVRGGDLDVAVGQAAGQFL
jgi:hypothetical protein